MAKPGLKLSACISIQGAREHNLKELSLDIPRDRFVVITGVSGSGKSTLAFDLLYAEGQRRFLDSMSAYARQFVQPLAKPDVDLISGLPPVVSIEQRNSRGGGKSTVATVTEIYHFVRLIYSKLGVLNCPKCHVPVQEQSRAEVAQRLLAEAAQRGDLRLLSPIIQNRKGFHQDIAKWAAKQGYREMRVDGKLVDSDTPLNLDRYREHTIEVVAGVLPFAGRTPRTGPIPECVDTALRLGKGVLLAMDSLEHVTIHSTSRCCPSCLQSFEPLEPKMFSYNSSRGWCPSCRGFGELFYLPDVERGANADSIEESWFQWQEGKRELCPECLGARLNPIARSVYLQLATAEAVKQSRKTKGSESPKGLSLEALGLMPVTDAMAYFDGIHLDGLNKQIAEESLREIRERLKFLNAVGLGYLQLGRGIPTLSSGEAQRIRLAAQLGSNLSGVLYILDEPTIGLHARDNDRLLETLAALRARGNSLVVVEHDEATIRAADYIIDLGPGAGINGGHVVAAGTIEELRRHKDSLTGKFLNTKKSFPARGARRPVIISAGAAR
jgi:excinuclease ABC subunit A